MEIIPDTEAYRNTAKAASNNFEVFDADVREPSRIVYGFSPKSRASYDAVTDTVYIGPEIIARNDESSLVTLEHENIHYEQFRRILGESSDDIYDQISIIEEEALKTALDSFQDKEFIDSLTYNQHLNYHNFQTMIGLATGNEEFIDELQDLRDSAERRIKFLDGENPLEESPREVSYNASAQTAEEIAQNYWEDILGKNEPDQLKPLIERYNGANIENDDVLEAQAQFWSIFRLGGLEQLPEENRVYPKNLEKLIDRLEFYTGKGYYNRGENVKEQTKRLVEEFRERKNTEDRRHEQIPTDILNEGLNIWKREDAKALAD